MHTHTGDAQHMPCMLARTGADIGAWRSIERAPALCPSSQAFSLRRMRRKRCACVRSCAEVLHWTVLCGAVLCSLRPLNTCSLRLRPLSTHPACLPIACLPAPPPPPQKYQGAFDFGDGSDGNATEASGSQADGSDGSATKGGSIASGVNRLKNAGTAISAYEPEPIAASGAVGLACGFGWVDPNFQVGGPLCVIA